MITLTTILLILYIHQVWINMELISGCEFRGDNESTYLERFILLKSKWIRIFLHKFHRSDADDLHDHPWSFISIILWRGYIEHTKPKFDITYPFFPSKVGAYVNPNKVKRIWPGMIIYRKAEHAHRVELLNNKPAYTLVLSFKYKRQWGFYINRSVWSNWRDYYRQKGC